MISIQGLGILEIFLPPTRPHPHPHLGFQIMVPWGRALPVHGDSASCLKPCVVCKCSRAGCSHLSLLHADLRLLKWESANSEELAWSLKRTCEQTCLSFSGPSHGLLRLLLNIVSRVSVSLSRASHSPRKASRSAQIRLGCLHLTLRLLAHSANSLAL